VTEKTYLLDLRNDLSESVTYASLDHSSSVVCLPLLRQRRHVSIRIITICQGEYRKRRRT